MSAVLAALMWLAVIWALIANDGRPPISALFESIAVALGACLLVMLTHGAMWVVDWIRTKPWAR